jgi:hypothetical protein
MVVVVAILVFREEPYRARRRSAPHWRLLLRGLADCALQHPATNK